MIGVVCSLLLSGVALAQKPARNVNPNRHPNIAAAQRLCYEAFEKISVAQQANEFDMKGHAAKAKELLEQANAELKLAAEAANAAKGPQGRDRTTGHAHSNPSLHPILAPTPRLIDASSAPPASTSRGRRLPWHGTSRCAR